MKLLILTILLSKLEGYISSGFLFYLLAILAVILLGLWNYARMAPAYKLLIQFSCIVFLSEALGAFFESSLGTNYPFYHALQFVEFIYYGLIFYKLLKPASATRSWLVWLVFVLATSAFMVSLFYQGIHTFPSIGSSLLSLYVVIATLVLFVKMIQSPIDIPILKQPAFWFGVGSLFFHTLTFYIFGYFKLLSIQSQVPDWGYLLIRISNFILYGCYFLCIFFASRSPYLKK